MLSTVYEIAPSRVLKKYSQQDLKALIAADSTPLWIDINQRDTESLTEFLHSLEIHPLALEACLETVPDSHIGIYEKSLFIGLPIVLNANNKDHSFLTILCLPGKLITIHEDPIPALNDIVENYSSSITFRLANTSAVLYQILDHIVDQEIALALKVRDTIDKLEKSFETEEFEDPASEIDRLRRQAIHFEAILEDQYYCVSSLQSIESSAFSVEGIHDYIRDIMYHQNHAVKSVGRQIDRLTALRQLFLLQLQDKTNKRLQILTIVSTIFLPLMLITGIYGMNFQQMPELSWQYGYPLVLLSMGVTAAGLILWIAHKGWFKL